MRLNRYVTEGQTIITVGGSRYEMNDVDMFMKWWNKVEKDCRYILKDLRHNNRNNKVIWRGINGMNDWSIGKKAIRTERSPKDTSYEWHNAFDEVFYKKFGWRPRSEGLFVAGGRSTAVSYGAPCFVFPVGRYSFLWSQKINDLYAEIENYNWEESDQWREEKHQEWEDEYGEGGSGSWYWEGNDTGENDKDEAVQWVLNSWKEENEDQYEDEDEMNNDMPSEKSINRELEWEPNTSLDEFMNHQDYEPEEDDYYDAAEDIISSGKYKNTDIVKALEDSRAGEIMIGVSREYYFFGEKWYDLVMNAIFNTDNPDPRQMSFDFKK